MPITITNKPLRTDIDRLTAKYHEMMVKLDADPESLASQAAEHTRKTLNAPPLQNSGEASPSGTGGRKIEYVTEETVQNVFALFSGYFTHFDFGPKTVKKIAFALKDIPTWLVFDCAMKYMSDMNPSIRPDPDIFASVVRMNSKFADMNMR